MTINSFASYLDEKYGYFHNLEIMKLAYVRKLPSGKWRVFSEKGKNLGTFHSKEKAEKHLREIEYFKHIKKASNDDSIDLTNIDNLSLSAIMRELRKQCDDGVINEFLSIHKDIFDRLIIEGKDKGVANKAILLAILAFGKRHKILLGHK
jgi:hypothetical protein